MAIVLVMGMGVAVGLSGGPGVPGPGAPGTPPPAPPAPPTAAPPGPGPGCPYPAAVLDLRHWEVTLPIGSKDEPKEVTQPELATFVAAPWFQPVAGCAGVVFRASVAGVTTSGSDYPRSELREMGTGGELASWSSDSGTHTLVVDEAFTALPRGKPQLVGAQIHGSDDDVSVFRLEGSHLYVTKGDNPHYKLVTSRYALGTRFEAKFVVSGNTIRAFYNGMLVATIAKKFSKAYFKAGAYTQANCDNAEPCEPTNYGETVLYRLTVEHS